MSIRQNVSSSPGQLQPAPLWVRCAAGVVRRMPAARYRLMNQLARRPMSPFQAKMPDELGGYTFACDLRDSIAREVCFMGYYEPQETALLRWLLKPGMIFVDVGANWGYFTLLAAHLVGGHGRVLSLEPDPRMFRLLEQNVQMNHLTHAAALQIAAADETATLRMQGFDTEQGNWGLSRLTSEPTLASDAFEVSARPLDELLDEQGVDQVDLVKIDVEGAEDLVLRGMSRGLEEGRYRRILLEVHPGLLRQRSRDVNDVIEQLLSSGFQGWRIDHSLQATRRAAYSRAPRGEDYLAPLDPDTSWDAWPHLLWALPQAELVA